MSENKLIITNFTDPVCTWCWGEEPIFRRLETHFPGQIEFRYVMGGLVRNIDEFTDPSNHIDAGSEGANKQIVSHWKESEKRHRMPIQEEGFALFSKENPSTYPQNIAYKAAQMVDPKRADLFLKRIREKTLAFAEVTSRTDVLMSIASEVGIDVGPMLKHLRDGSAEKAFHTDMALGRNLGISGFPSFIVKYNNSSYLLRGFTDYDTFDEVIFAATNGTLDPIAVPPTEEALEILVLEQDRMAREEVFQAFDFTSREEADAMVDGLVEKGRLQKEMVDQNYFVRPTKTTLGGSVGLCDFESGVC